MRKAIKKIRTILTTIVLVIMGLLLIAFVVVLLPPVQNQIRLYLTESLESSLGVRVNIGDIRYFPFTTIQISDVQIFDKSDSLLLDISTLKVELALSSIVEKSIIVESLVVDSLRLSVYERNDSTLNISDILSNGDTVQTNKTFQLSTITLRNGSIGYRTQSNGSYDVNEIAFSLNNVMVADDDIRLGITNLSFIENNLQRKLTISAQIQKDNDTISICDFQSQIGKSLAIIDTASVVLSNGKIANAMVDISHVLVDYEDLYIANNQHDKVVSNFWFLGQFFFDGENLYSPDFRVKCADGTSLMSDILIKNILDKSNAYISLNISQLYTNLTDISNIVGIQQISQQTSKALGNIDFRGYLRGPLNNLLFEGTLNSGIGVIGLNSEIKTKEDNNIVINGRIDAPEMDFGALTENVLTQSAFEADFDALFKDKLFVYNHIKGKIDCLTMKKYSYRNILIDIMTQGGNNYGVVDFADENGAITAVAEYVTDEALPRYSITAKVDKLRTGALNLTPSIPQGELSLTMRSEFEGDDVDNIKGQIWVGDVNFLGMPQPVSTKSFAFNVDEANDGLRHAIIESDNLNGTASGNFMIYDIINEIRYQLSLASNALFVENHNYNNNKSFVDFDISYDNISQYVQFISPDLSIDSNGKIEGRIDARDHSSNIVFKVGKADYGTTHFDDAVATFGCHENVVIANLVSQYVSLPILGNIGLFSLTDSLTYNNITTSIRWNDVTQKNLIGSINTNIKFTRDNEFLNYFAKIDSSLVTIANRPWAIHPSRLYYNNQLLVVDSFKIENGDRYLAADGSLSKISSGDSLRITLNRITIGDFLRLNPARRFALDGDISAAAQLTCIAGDIYADADVDIDKFYVNNDRLDHLDLKTSWRPDKEQLGIEVAIITDDKMRARAIGALNTKNNNFDLKFDIDSISDGFLNYYLHEPIKDIKGSTSGWLRLHGTLPDIKLDARLCVHKTDFTIRQTLVTYTFDGNDTLIIAPNYIEFCNLRFSDPYGQHGNFYGHISHNMFTGLGLHINFQMNNQLVLNTKAVDNPAYYGTLFADGLLSVTGSTSNPFLNIEATTQNGSEFVIQPLEKSDIAEQDYIKFSSKADNELLINKNEMLNGVAARVDVNIRQNTKISAVLNSRTGNMITANGDGKLRLNIDKSGDLSIFGNYLIDNGIYNFSFGNVVDKKFIINNGGNIVWDGDPYNASVDLTATYKVKAALSDLVANNPEVDITDLKRRVPINCNIILSNRLVDPTIKFKIEVPSSQNFNQYTFDQYVNTEEEMNRQAFSLLLANRFYAIQNVGTTANNQNYIGSAATDLLSSQLSNQLSNWISQNKYNVGVGVNYRPGDEVTNEEYEVELSTQMLNNKIILSGNIGYGRNATETSEGSFIGDFDVEVKLNKKGNLRAKAYTHSNNDIIYETSPTTQGVGVSFNEEFNTFCELFHKYWDIITFKRHREKNKNKE